MHSLSRLLCLVISLWTGPLLVAAQDTHPLDPLSKDEIALSTQILKESGKITEASRFATIELHEPPKAEVLTFKPGMPFRREAFVVVYERTANKPFEAIVDLRNKAVISWTEMPGAQPQFLPEEDPLVQSIVRQDPQWQAAIRKRGISEFEKVHIDVWPNGNFGLPDEQGKRLFRCLSYYRGDSKMQYVQPIEGVIAVVDVGAKKVLRLIDTGVVPVPQASADLDEKLVGSRQAPPKPLEIIQPQGASFEIHGHEIRWQNWRFRYALNPREGLVLYMIGYEDQGRVRPILYRASLSEMVVPYGDPSEGWFFRNVFDEGEFGMGVSAVQLEDSTDVPNNATLLSAVFANESGSASEKPRRIALYERDGGTLWKHVDYLTDHNESRRARQLVLSFFTVAGNYDYGFNWVFHQDGTLEMEVLLTGVMSNKGVLPLSAEHDNYTGEPYAHLVADGVAAPHHQHFFNFRLDFDLDGTNNTVVEQNTEALPPGQENPYHNAFVMREMSLRCELEAQRQLNLASNRRWRVINPTVKNALGQPVGYLLLPGENSVPYASPDSSLRKRAAFINSHLWVTQYAQREIYAAGDYVNQSKDGEGLPAWIKQNRLLEDQDIVVWYTMGVTHLPRPEDYPVMPVHKAGFKLAPYSFFMHNPALDVPKPEARDNTMKQP